MRFAAGPDDLCMAGRSRAEVAADARARAAELGLTPGARVLSTRDWSGYADWIDALLAPLSVGGSVVYVRNCTDPAVLDAGRRRSGSPSCRPERHRAGGTGWARPAASTVDRNTIVVKDDGPVGARLITYGQRCTVTVENGATSPLVA